MMVMFTAVEEWVIIHIEVGDGLFDRGVWWLISSLMEVTYPIHGIVYKSALIGHRHATHPVVDVLMWCDLGVWHQFVMVFSIWFINKAVKTEKHTEVIEKLRAKYRGRTIGSGKQHENIFKSTIISTHFCSPDKNQGILKDVFRNQKVIFM